VLVISAVIPFIHQPLPPPAPQPPIYVLIETPEGVVSFENVQEEKDGPGWVKFKYSGSTFYHQGNYTIITADNNWWKSRF
jgi:hypothetical protein